MGKTVVVQGAGPIGLMIVAVLRSMGAQPIIVTDLVEERLAMARRLGADVTLDVAQTSLEERVGAIAGGLGADIVIEAAGVGG